MFALHVGTIDRPDAGVDIKKSGWDSDRDSNIAVLERPDAGTEQPSIEQLYFS